MVAPEVTSSATNGAKDGERSGGSDGGGSKTAELLYEATLLLKTLRVPPTNPQLESDAAGWVGECGERFHLAGQRCNTWSETCSG